MAVTTAIAAVASAAVGGYSAITGAQQANRAQKQAREASEKQLAAETEAMKRANQRKPDLTAIMAANTGRGAKTDLTGGQAAPTAAMLGRNTLLGG